MDAIDRSLCTDDAIEPPARFVANVMCEVRLSEPPTGLPIAGPAFSWRWPLLNLLTGLSLAAAVATAGTQLEEPVMTTVVAALAVVAGSIALTLGARRVSGAWR